MHDALVVRGCERVGEGRGTPDHAVHRHPALGDEAVEGLAFDKLHGEEVNALGFFNREDRDDAGMIEGGQGLGLAAEALQAIRVCGHRGRQHLERHVAAELRVGGAIHLAHAAGSDSCRDAVVGECPADHEAPFSIASTIATCFGMPIVS